MSVTAPFPGSAPVTEEEERQLRRYFEQTRAIVNDLATRFSDWAVEACVAHADYCVEHYGQCPAYFNPMQCNFRRHKQEWHT